MFCEHGHTKTFFLLKIYTFLPTINNMSATHTSLTYQTQKLLYTLFSLLVATPCALSSSTSSLSSQNFLLLHPTTYLLSLPYSTTYAALWLRPAPSLMALLTPARTSLHQRAIWHALYVQHRSTGVSYNTVLHCFSFLFSSRLPGAPTVYSNRRLPKRARRVTYVVMRLLTAVSKGAFLLFYFQFLQFRQTVSVI